ncbi:MAG: Rpn family recombination-promoting nuclease/putative transposase [Roseburia inulinivorans]
MNPTKETSSLSYLNATGHIPYGMTNDYMFRLILEKNNYVLKGLICSLLSLTPEKITSVEIQNPILLNETVKDKEFILDIKVLMNDSAIINLEMQMAYMLNWRERSLSYLCRAFDQLSHGQLYDNVKPAIHIGFLNFNPTPDDKPEFYASYKLLNEKTHARYSDKFILRVVNLKQIDSATDEDRANRIDYWARLFTATTWEEIKMLAQNNDFIASASQSLYESNADEITREKCRARENYMCLERKLAEQEARTF